MNKLILLLITMTISISANAAGLFCKQAVDLKSFNTYAVPDSIKSFSTLNSEISKLEIKLRSYPVGSAEYNDLSSKITDKKAIRDTKIDYESNLKVLEKDIRLISIAKDKLHQEAISLYNQNKITEASNLCNGLSAGGTWNCAKETQYENQIKDKQAEIKDIKVLQKQELGAQSYASVGNTVKTMKLNNKASGAQSPFGIFDPSSIRLNDDADGFSGKPLLTTKHFYTCFEAAPTYRTTVFAEIPYVLEDNYSSVKMYYCPAKHNQTGECLSAEKASAPNSGWKVVDIAKNSSTEKKLENDTFIVLSSCEKMGTENEKCTLTFKIYGEGDTNGRNLSTKSEQILSSNPSYKKLVDQTNNMSNNPLFNEAKDFLVNQGSCIAETVKGTQDSSDVDSREISCKKPILDENNKIIRDSNGNIMTTDFVTNLDLAKQCTEKEVCLQEVLETVKYDKNCVAPFPTDTVNKQVTTPEGNCAIKFSKEAYTCSGKRTMDTRNCDILREQEIKECEAETHYDYRDEPFYGALNPSTGKKVWSLDSDYDSSTYTDSAGTDKLLHERKNIHGARKGVDSVSISVLNKEKDIGKFLKFRISSYHDGGKYGNTDTPSGCSRCKPWVDSQSSFLAIDLNNSTPGEIPAPSSLGKAPDGSNFKTIGNGILDRDLVVLNTCYYSNTKKTKYWSTWTNEQKICVVVTATNCGGIKPVGDFLSQKEETLPNGDWLIKAPFGTANVCFKSVYKTGGEHYSLPVELTCKAGEFWNTVDSYFDINNFSNGYVSFPTSCAVVTGTDNYEFVDELYTLGGTFTKTSYINVCSLQFPEPARFLTDQDSDQDITYYVDCDHPLAANDSKKRSVLATGSYSPTPIKYSDTAYKEKNISVKNSFPKNYSHSFNKFNGFLIPHNVISQTVKSNNTGTCQAAEDVAPQ